MAPTPLPQPQFGFKYAVIFGFDFLVEGRSESFGFLPVNWSRKTSQSRNTSVASHSSNPRRSSLNEVARPHHFIPLQTPEAFRNAGSRGCFWFARLLRWFGQAVHCHLVRSHSAFAIVANGFDRTSFIAALTPIPYIGPALAAATAPEMAALALSYASAAGGFDVPPGRAPTLTAIHPNEMVLPAEHADTVRRLGRTGGGGGMGGGQNNFNQTLNIQSLDPSSLGDILSRNPSIVAGVVAQWIRGGGQPYTG
jgi:hypothetical protein